MASDERRSLEHIEHDHTRIDVLFEDLGATARMVIQYSTDVDILEDTRQTWQHLLEELLGHFGREEHLLFKPLALQRPELMASIQQVTQQHTVLRSTLQSLGQALCTDGASSELLSQQFESQWPLLQALWDEHSALEWKLLEPLRAEMTPT